MPHLTYHHTARPRNRSRRLLLFRRLLLQNLLESVFRERRRRAAIFFGGAFVAHVVLDCLLEYVALHHDEHDPIFSIGEVMVPTTPTKHTSKLDAGDRQDNIIMNENNDDDDSRVSKRAKSGQKGQTK